MQQTADTSVAIVRYKAEHQEEWDRFVFRSKNGTFLLNRHYMDYHADRFADHSLMFYLNGRLVALLPAHATGETLCSHNGLTYGGLITSNRMSASLMLDVFAALTGYLSAEGFKELIYRPIPYIYHKIPADEDLYALYRFGAASTQRRISSVVDNREPLPFSELRRRKVRKAERAGYRIVADDRLDLFWPMLELTLRSRHDATPVHSLQEMMELQSYFLSNIVLYRVVNSCGDTVAGTLIYLTSTVAHVQYIASTEEGRANGAVDMLFDKLVHQTFADVRYFDFGTSVEQGGAVLNEGLIFQKEGFGGRAVMYDTYLLKL